MSAAYAAAARRLRDAYSGAVAAPLRDILEPTDAAGAHAVQTINTWFWEARGRRIVAQGGTDGQGCADPARGRSRWIWRGRQQALR